MGERNRNWGGGGVGAGSWRIWDPAGGASGEAWRAQRPGGSGRFWLWGCAPPVGEVGVLAAQHCPCVGASPCDASECPCAFNPCLSEGFVSVSSRPARVLLCVCVCVTSHHVCLSELPIVQVISPRIPLCGGQRVCLHASQVVHA